MRDKVFIRDLSLRGKHGVYEWEWEKPREFIFDITADFDISKAAKSDKLEDTVCWTYLHKIAKEVIDGPTIFLIERIADTVAQRILEGEERVAAVTVTIRKNEILEEGVPGVTITRTRECLCALPTPRKVDRKQ